MKATDPPATVQFSVRLPGELHQKLAELANAEERTLNTTVVRALREYVEANR